MAFSSFGEFLRAARSRYPGFSKRMREAEALVRWDTAVGPVIAKHARAVRIQDGVLWVEVDHPIWRQELHLRRRQILENLNRPAGSRSPYENLGDFGLNKPAGKPGPTDAGNLPADAPITDILFIDPRTEGKPGARTFGKHKQELAK